jgi:hypothetical protein
LCEGLASVLFIACQNTLYLVLWFHVRGNVEV